MATPQVIALRDTVGYQHAQDDYWYRPVVFGDNLFSYVAHVPPGGDQKSGSHQVRVEAYLRDPRSISVEDVATFKVPVQSRDRDRIATEMSEVEDFVHERVTAFLSQFPK